MTFNNACANINSVMKESTKTNKQINEQAIEQNETVDLEQDADVILFIHRKDYYSQDANKGVAEIIIGKNRHGSVFSTNLKFSSSTGRFSVQKESW